MMRTPERTAAMRKYFTVFPARIPSFGTIIKIGIGLFLFGALIMYFFNNTALAGTLSMAIGIAIFAFWLMPYINDKRLYAERPSLENMYKWLVNDWHTKIKERASETLRLNINTLKPENFMIVPYPVYWSEAGIKDEHILSRETKEGNMIYSLWKVQVVALTKNYISFYSCTYDWLNDMITGERTNEFFYDDIASVKNDVESLSRKLKGEELEKSLTSFVFKVTNMSSDHLTVITKIPELNYSPRLEVSLEKAVQALRIILRKRRYNEDQEPIYTKPELPDNQDETDNGPI
jgi:hypothetical protein